MPTAQKPKQQRKRRQRNAIEGLEDDAYGTLVEAALQAKKIATLQRVAQLLEEVKSMLAMEGFHDAPIQREVLENERWRPMGQPAAPPPVPDNPCVECGRDGIWQAPSTKQWFCIHHEAIGKGRYADDRQTSTSPTLRVVQTPQTAQRAVAQPPPSPPAQQQMGASGGAIENTAQQPILMATVEGGAPVLQEQPAATGDALRDEMNRLMNGGAI